MDTPQTYLVMTLTCHEDGKVIVRQKLPMLNVHHARWLARRFRRLMHIRKIKKVAAFSYSIISQYPPLA